MYTCVGHQRHHIIQWQWLAPGPMSVHTCLIVLSVSTGIRKMRHEAAVPEAAAVLTAYVWVCVSRGGRHKGIRPYMIGQDKRSNTNSHGALPRTEHRQILGGLQRVEQRDDAGVGGRVPEARGRALHQRGQQPLVEARDAALLFCGDNGGASPWTCANRRRSKGVFRISYS